MSPLRPLALSCVVLSAVAGCAPHIVRSNGPVRSPEGVEVSVIDGVCRADLGSRRRTTAHHQVAVSLHVENRTAESLVVRPERVRVAVRQEELAVAAPTTPLHVAAKDFGDLTLSFQPGTVCNSRFRLDFTAAVFLRGGRPTAVPVLEFTPDDLD